MGCPEKTTGRAAIIALACALVGLPAGAQQTDKAPPPGLALQEGVTNQLNKAISGLSSGTRGASVTAMDEAFRVLEVAKYSELSRGMFSEAESAVKQARRALQNGRRADAVAKLEQAVSALEGSDVPQLGRKADLAEYEGAILVNADGKTLGELNAEVESEGVVAVIGNWQDTLGFIDLGGQEVVLPRDMIILGKPAPLGGDIAVLADSSRRYAVKEKWRR